jgi:dsDNA-specific endonuclease/ATPase MutS2
MNIGDKVRLLHGKEEGVITKLSSGGQVEIEIEDGFRIPALKSEVVLIHEAEGEYFDTKQDKSGKSYSSSPAKKSITDIRDGVYMAYVPYNDQVHDMVLINNSTKDCLYSIDELQGDNAKNLGAGVVKAKSFTKLGEKLLEEFEQWPPFSAMMLLLNKRLEKKQPVQVRNIKFKASSFFRCKGTAPLLDKSAYFFKLDDSVKNLDVTKLNKELNPVQNDSYPAAKVKRPPASVDLHIEKLTQEYDLMSNSEMLQLQVKVFESNLNDAIASGMDEIVFIHGIGNGVLRKEIHKNLSQLKGIKYFKDSQKTNFGYGATTVKINE